VERGEHDIAQQPTASQAAHASVLQALSRPWAHAGGTPLIEGLARRRAIWKALDPHQHQPPRLRLDYLGDRTIG
jgi:hypothetical protein